MKQSTKIWLLTAAALVVLGLTLLGFALSRWDFDFTANYESYAREYMQLKLPTEFDTSVLERCNLANLGRTLCDRLDCKMTVYGVVSNEGGQIFATVRPVEDEEEQMDIDEAEQEMGGMQM